MSDEAVVSPAELIARPVAFDSLYEHEYVGLVRLAYAFTGRRDVAEELVQDAFEAAHRHWGRVSRLDQPGAWVRRTVVHRCVSRHRRVLVEAAGLLRLRGRAEARESAREPVLANDDVWVALRALPPRQREVLALIYVDDRSVEETAALLQCSPVTVRTHLRRGRIAMAEQLGLNSEEQAHD